MEIRSPFPGMDPWLEKHWRDVHAALITYVRDALNPQLPGGLRARMEERVFVESPLGESGEVYPDVRIVAYNRTDIAQPEMPRGSVVATEPLLIELPTQQITESYIQIIDTDSGNKLVTTIEFLSPSNKRKGAGQQQFLEKQQQMLSAKVNVVEIDLLRIGRRVLILRPEHIPSSHRTAYQAGVWRAARPTFYAIYRVPLRAALPSLSIPLRAPDHDVILNLQSLIEEAYSKGRYDSIDYSIDPSPPLDPDDAAWADTLLKSKAKR